MRAPNCNGFAKRFVRSINEECLDRKILFGEASRRRALAEYLAHYHHVPLDVIGEHAEKQVRSDPLLLVMVNGANFQIHGLDGTKGPFHLAECLVLKEIIRVWKPVAAAASLL